MKFIIAHQRILFKIRIYRESFCLSQREMAEKLAMGLRTYQRIENGEKEFDIDFLFRFCREFNLNFCSLTTPDCPDLLKSFIFFNISNEEEFLQNMNVKNSSLIEISRKFDTIFDKDNFCDLECFKNNSLPFSYASTTKKILNAKANELTTLENSCTKLGVGFKNLDFIINLYDCLFYYRPKFSIIKISKNNFSFKEHNVILFSTHHYSAGEIESISYFHHQLIS